MHAGRVHLLAASSASDPPPPALAPWTALARSTGRGGRCDRLTISPTLLDELTLSQEPIERHLEDGKEECVGVPKMGKVRPDLVAQSMQQRVLLWIVLCTAAGATIDG